MKILFTGGSSFTGFWIVSQLVKDNHDVVITFTGSQNSYSGIRLLRIKKLLANCEAFWNTSFGDDSFIELLEQQKFDIICHHGAYVSDYKSDEFCVHEALRVNTNNLQQITQLLKRSSLKKIILTGTVFEENEGVGEAPMEAFSPYGLSKGFTANLFSYWCKKNSIPLAKFVIPNPFGPYEEPRFTTYLINTWKKGQTANVRTPLYIRDNIHVSLLAVFYSKFLSSDSLKINPSGYVESQGSFANRFALEMRKRIKYECKLNMDEQTDFSEPLIRINTDIAKFDKAVWNENKAWDELAEYYRQM